MITAENIFGLLALHVVASIILLARCSHWAHATQQKLEETNRLLRAVAGEKPTTPAVAVDPGPGV